MRPAGDIRYVRQPFYRYLRDEFNRGVMDPATLRLKLMRRWALPGFFADDILTRWLRKAR